MAINLFGPQRTSRPQTGLIDESGYVGGTPGPTQAGPFPQGFNDLPGAFQDSGWPPKGGWQLGDFPNALGNLANWVLMQQAGLVPQQTGIYSGILQGQTPAIADQAKAGATDMARQMSDQFNDQLTQYFNKAILDPMMAQNAAQIQQAGTQAMRQADDYLPAGVRAMSKANAMNDVIEQTAKSNTALQTQLGGQLGMGALQNAQGLYRDVYNNQIAGLYNPLVMNTWQGALGQDPISKVEALLNAGGAQRVGAENAKTARKQGGGGLFK